MRSYRDTEKVPLLLTADQEGKRLPQRYVTADTSDLVGPEGRDSWWRTERTSPTSSAKPKRIRRVLLVLLLVMASFLLGVLLCLLVVALAHGSRPRNWLDHAASQSLMTKFKYSAIATDAAPCVNIGNYIMLVKRGNAIDGTIATMLCTGVYNLHSMGISGGSFLVFYERATRKTYTLDFRETAPRAANETMFVGKPDHASLYGGLSIAVPGEVAGYYEAWKRFGTVEWEELFQPTIDLLREGYHVFPSMDNALQQKLKDVETYANPTLKNFLYDKAASRWVKTGDVRTLNTLADTLEKISKEPLAMYNGSLAKTIVSEIQSVGGLVTEEDLRTYKPEWREPVSIPLINSPYIVHGMPPPSSGAVVAFILNIMSGYGYHLKNISSLRDVGTYFHRFVESSKFAFAKRSALGDMNFATAEMQETLKSLLDVSNAERTRQNISDTKTFDVNYYGPSFDFPTDRGTSHIGVIDSEGNAVAMTSTINGEFGSMVMGPKTGITYNNEMDDFSSPNKSNQYNLPPSPSNFIRAGKRPMSSMAPIIVTDKDTGAVKLVLGGSGGSRIISAVSQVAGYHIFLNMTVKEAIDMWRFHHQLVPNAVQPTSNFPNELLHELRAKGHMIGGQMPGTAVQGLAVEADGFIYGNADYRKNGQAAGI